MSNLAPQWQAFLPKIACSGNFFRTLAFAHDMAPDMHSWYEAAEHPLTNLWQISEVYRRPNTIAGDSSLIEESRVISGKSQVTLVEALETLAQYEIAQTGMGYKQVGADIKSIGADHVRAFAAAESCVLDVYGHVHPVVSGRIVTNGVFADGTREAVLQTKPAANDPVLKAERLDLSHLFRTSAQVDDFSRYLDLKVDKKRWNEFVTNVVAIAQLVEHTQARKFPTTSAPIKLTGGFITRNGIVEGQNELASQIEECSKDMQGFSFLTQAHKDMLEGYFKDARLSFEVAHAKCLFEKFNQAEPDLAQGMRKKFEAQTEKAAALCRHLGGSEADIQRINAEVISGKMHAHNLRERGYKTLASNYSWGHNPCYYLPDSLLNPLVTLMDMGKQLDRAIEAEQARINRTPSESFNETSKPDAAKKAKGFDLGLGGTR